MGILRGPTAGEGERLEYILTDSTRVHQQMRVFQQPLLTFCYLEIYISYLLKKAVQGIIANGKKLKHFVGERSK